MSGLRIAVRTDASTRIGTGHVVRCLALARALRDTGAELLFIARPFDVDLSTLLREFASSFTPLQRAPPGADPAGPTPYAGWAGVGWQMDADDTIDAARAFSPTHLIVDHYAFDARWHRRVTNALACQLVVIDDLADRDLDGSLLVDHNLCADHRAKYGRHWPAGRPLCGGPRFALLDARYTTSARASVRAEVNRLGIFMGGADAAGYSARVIRACREQAGYRGEIEVVTTSANPALEALRGECDRFPPSHLSVDLPDLADFHARQDLEVGAGGGASWERCCIGVPTLLIVTADNQQLVVEELMRAGAAAVTSPAASPDEASIGQAVRVLLDDSQRRASLADNARRVVDGLGAWRVAARIAAHRLELRPATSADARQIHRWRNDPAVRAVSSDPGEISWESHQHWFERALADPARAQFIAHLGTRDLGVIRFDRRDDGYHDISLFLDPALHGLGLGGRLLSAGEKEIGIDASFRARVVKGNERSHNLFAAAGYIRHSPELWLKQPSRADREESR